MTTYIYAKAFYFEDEVKGPGYLPILDNGTFGVFQTEKVWAMKLPNFSVKWTAISLITTLILPNRKTRKRRNNYRLRQLSNCPRSCGYTYSRIQRR